MDIFVDADACPVKPEVYRVAGRYGLKVVLVANKSLAVPPGEWIRLVVVPGGFNAADDWIAGQIQAGDILVTADIPLAARCVSRQACVLSPAGKIFTEDNMGTALATRDLLCQLRECGEITGGPPPFSRRDRSRFLQRLDDIIQRLRRNR